MKFIWLYRIILVLVMGFFSPLLISISYGQIVKGRYVTYLPFSEYTETHYTRGNQYMDKGAYELAVREYQLSLKANTTYRIVYKKLGDAYQCLNSYPSAIETYLKYVGFSNNTNDTDGKNMLLEIAGIYDKNLYDPTNALKTVDGILSFYYPESFDSVAEITDRYRNHYLASFDSTKTNDGIHWKNVDPIWQKAMFYKASLLLQENHKKEAFEVYS